MARFWLIPVDLVIDVDNTPGALAKVAAAISDHLVYVATGNRVVFGSPDLESLKSALAASG